MIKKISSEVDQALAAQIITSYGCTQRRYENMEEWVQKKKTHW